PSPSAWSTSARRWGRGRGWKSTGSRATGAPSRPGALKPPSTCSGGRSWRAKGFQEGVSNEPVARSDRTGRPSPAKERARRLFIAVPLTAALQEAVVRVRAPLPDGRAIRGVAPETFHTPLRFLGSAPERRRAELAGALRG